MPQPLASRPSAADSRLAMRLFLGHACLLGLWNAVGMPGSAVLGGFALNVLGMSRENVGLMGSCMYGAAVWQFLSFNLTNRVQDRKRFVLAVGAGEMLLLALVPLVPVVFGVRSLAAWGTFLALLFLSSTCLHLTQPLLNAWLSTVIPSRIRGRYLGSRQLLLTALQTLGVWGGLRCVHRWPSRAGFAVVILAGCAMGVAAYLLLLRAPMPQTSRESRFHLADFRGVLRPGPFRTYLAFTLMLFSGFSLACSYYVPFFLDEIGLGFAQIGWYVVGHNVLMVAVLRPGGRLVDRIGARPLLVFMSALYALFFLSFPVFTLPRYWLIFTAWSLVGIADGLYCVAGTSTLYHVLPRGPERAGYLAVAQGLTMISMGVGPFIVRAYLWLAGDWETTVAGVRLESFRAMYAFCGVLMLLTTAMAFRLTNTRRVHLGQVVTAMLRSRPFTLWPRFWVPDPRSPDAAGGRRTNPGDTGRGAQP